MIFHVYRVNINIEMGVLMRILLSSMPNTNWVISNPAIWLSGTSALWLDEWQRQFLFVLVFTSFLLIQVLLSARSMSSMFSATIVAVHSPRKPSKTMMTRFRNPIAVAACWAKWLRIWLNSSVVKNVGTFFSVLGYGSLVATLSLISCCNLLMVY